MDIDAYKKGLLGLMGDFGFIDGFSIDPYGNLTVMIASYDSLAGFGNTVTSYGMAFRELERAYARHSPDGAFKCNTMISRVVPDFVKRAENTYFLRSKDLERYAPKGAEVIYAN